MANRFSFGETLTDPVRGRWAVLVVLALLTWIALVLRMALDFDGVLDTDVMNFGLAAYDFDLLAHQPHPPGYPGYVVFLKALHLVAPGLDPIALAKWGTRLCGLGVIGAAYWACHGALGGGIEGRGRSLVAAIIAVFHPVLWFYGGDGQSHGAEALLALVLFGLCVRVKRSARVRARVHVLIVVGAFALAGSVRPTIPLLASPLLVWLLWKRPRADWIAAAVVGATVVAIWVGLLMWASGGYDLHRRATRALVSDIFIANYSVFGERAALQGIAANVTSATWAALFSMVPLLLLGPQGGRWRRAVLAVFIANGVFFALVFTAEVGYFSQVAALSVLVPATWPAARAERGRGFLARALVVAVACPALIFFGPESLPVPYSPPMPAPTFPRVVSDSNQQAIYTDLLCGGAADEPTLVLTDFPVTTRSRRLPMVCPNITVALWVHDLGVARLDNWLIFLPRTMHALPPPVPLEPGPPSTYVLRSLARVTVSPESTSAFAEEVASAASCEPRRYTPYGDEFPLLWWPASCFDTLRIGAHTLVIEDSVEPRSAPAPR